MPLVVVFTGALVATSPAAGQVSEKRVGDQVTCPECRVVTRQLVTLEQGGHAPEHFRQPPAGAVDQRGHIILTRGRDGPPVVYDSLGRFLRVLGRAGDGPGEYRFAELVFVGKGDTLYIVDRRAHRLSILDEDWNFIASARIPSAFSGDMTADGTLMLNGEAPDAAGVGKPFHSFDRMGNYRSSFGNADDGVAGNQGMRRMRRVTRSRRGGVWTATVIGEYMLEHWTADGERNARFRREPRWFPRTPSPRLTFSGDEPPDPYILSIAEDRAERIWVAIRTPDARWSDAVRVNPSSQVERAALPIIDDPDRAYDTRLEVIDPRVGSLIAAQVLDGASFKFVAPQRYLVYREREDGTTEIAIHEIWLEEGGR